MPGMTVRIADRPLLRERISPRPVGILPFFVLMFVPLATTLGWLHAIRTHRVWRSLAWSAGIELLVFFAPARRRYRRVTT